MANQKILITAALPYANGPVHIGHLAGCYIPADIYARFQRQKGNIVQFVGGTDEYGVPITIRALKEGISPQEIVDKYHKIISESFKAMNISFDIFTRTTKEIHTQTAQEFFLNLHQKGCFQEKVTEQYFDPEKEIFLADRYITGTCPVCQNENAYGDQCEKCGSTLSPEQLIDPKSTLSQATPIKKATKHWYFPLQDYEDFLKDWILAGKKDKWKNNVYGQCKSWLDNGLQPRAMTRDNNWGVPVPLPNAEGKVLYVWFDAPIGYISATKELQPKLWEEFWKKEDTKLVHFLGKDNIVFHCIIFPAMLKAHGDYILPDNVPANEFLNIEGQKVSTSRNWAVWVNEYIETFPDLIDSLRYVLCANAPETKDNDFTWKEFQQRHNSELVDIFGNFINRAMVLMHKLCDGRVPWYRPEEAGELEEKLIQRIADAKQKIEDAIEQYRFRDGLFEVIDLAREGNKYLQEKEPWQLAKTPELRVQNQFKIDTCIHLCLQLCANLAIFSYPFIPETSNKIRKMLTVVERILKWENAGKIDLLRPHYRLRAPELLFRKIEDKEMDEQREKLIKNTIGKKDTENHQEKTETKIAEFSNTIQFEDFTKVDLRVGTILKSEKVKNTDKLLHLNIDLGNEVRSILSGIAGSFAPEDIIGKQVIVVANLATRKMRGIESQGMILMTEDQSGKLVFLKPETLVSNGVVVK